MGEIKFKDDYKLVHSYLSGNEKSGQILYAGIFNFIEASIYKMTNDKIFNSSDREDILNDTFITSIEKLSSYNGRSKFSTFVYGIARNKVFEKYRSISKEVNKSELDSEYEYMDIINIYSKDPLEIIINKEKKESLKSAYDDLPPHYRELIQLRLINGMPIKDIATISNQSIDAVDSMYRRAIKTLNSNFKKIYN